MPRLAKDCIASWHKYMPDYEYKLWNEATFDVNITTYTREAYEAKKFAFVSDYVRLWALEREGGLYLDVDFEVYKPFDSLQHYTAFAGFEGSKHQPVMMGVCASEPHGEWVREMLEAYQKRHFIMQDGAADLTTNVQFITGIMAKMGFRQDGSEQDYKLLVEKRNLILIQKANPAHKTCSIGYSPKENKWYGWSHRAIYGFTVGDVVKEGDLTASSGFVEEYRIQHPDEDMALPVGYRARDLNGAKRMAIAFASAVG